MKPVFYSSYIVNIVVNSLLCFAAIAMNIVTIQAIRKTSSLPKPLKTLLLSLAVSDLGVGLLVQPLHLGILVMEMEGMTKSSPAYRNTFLAFVSHANLFSFASFFGVAALSADRFLAIHLHLRYQELVTHKRVVAVVISVWAFSAVLSLVRLWIPVNIIFAVFASNYLACLITAAFFNYKIYMAVRRHAHQIQVLQVQQMAQNVEVENVGRVKKSAVATIYIYLLFLLCYLPNACILWIIVINPNLPLNTIVHRYTGTLVFLNSSLNPFIYCWKMRHIRQAVMNILRNVFSCHN